MTASPAIMRLVLDVLPTEAPGISHKEIHAKVDVWSPITIKAAVIKLYKDGKVVRTGEPGAPGAKFYKRPEAA